MPNANHEDPRTGLEVAVIGMAGRFPQAKNIHEFWENLKNGVHCIKFFTDEELLEFNIPPHLLQDPDFVKARGVVEDVESFDAAFFGYTPREAEQMDPQMRLFYECTWHALEDAAYDTETFTGPIGVYVGGTANVFWEIQQYFFESRSDKFAATHLTSIDFLATRLAHRLNLKGPALTFQTACSTSLVAVDMACRELLTGQCDMALAGAVSVPDFKPGYRYQEGMILSPDGYCRAFDRDAKGVIFSDGMGIVVLKRLDDAIAARDRIYAIVKGSAVNNDGIRKNSFSAPCIDGQAEVIQRALQIAEVDSETITYIETHGTGTTLGDPIEIEALKQSFNTDKKNYCGIGSVKTNIGHLDTAAGIAGFIKTVLAVYHKLIPPSLHFKAPNPKIDFENSPFYVNTALKEWHGEYPLRAGVSSFGVGGTNAHAVLEETPPREPSSPSRPWQLIPLSANSETALDRVTNNFLQFLKDNPEINIADAAFTLKVGRRALKCRKMTVTPNVESLTRTLAAESDPVSPDADKIQTHMTAEEKRVVFMFSGQGAQYVNMGKKLYQNEPLFREEMDRCFKILKPLTGYNLKEILYPDVSPQSTQSTQSEKSYNKTSAISAVEINQTAITQPLLFVFAYALAQLLMKWGIKPYAMIGHSIGEYTAACLAGVFSLEDALMLVTLRGKLMQEMPRGSMLSISLSEEELAPLLAGNNDLDLAAVNAPSLCVVSGPEPAVADFARQLEEKGYKNRHLHTSHAFHSKMMEPLLQQFEQEAKKIKSNPPNIPFISNVTGKWTTVVEAMDPGYWAAHIRKPVRFADGLAQLLKEEHTIYLEVGPGSTLGTFARQHRDRKPEQQIVNLVPHPKENTPDDHYLLNKIGQLWLYGVSIDWPAFYDGEKRNRISLPPYPFARQSFPTRSRLYRMQADRDIILGQKVLRKRPDLSEWFYIPSWKRTLLPLPTPTGTETQKQELLVFTHDCPFCSRLIEKLEQQKNSPANITLVRKGKGFAQTGDSSYTLDPREEGNYYELFSKLQATGSVPRRILHLWNVTGNPSGELALENYDEYIHTSFYSLLYLAKAVGRQNITQKMKIMVLSDEMQEVNGEKRLSPPKACILGPVMTIPKEFPNLTCSSIDIRVPAPGSQEEGKLLNQLTTELNSDSADYIVAYRDIHRWVQAFEPAPLEKKIEGEIPRLKPGGVYLITGGLGGIGLVLAEHLAATVNARLLLTARSQFPTRDEWDHWLRSHPSQDPTSRKIKKIQIMEAAGAEILVKCADVTNLPQMQEAVGAAKNQWGTLDGVIHAAGIPGGGMIQLKTKEMAENVLAPKIKGTLVLHRLFKNSALDFFILCSSINSVLSILGQVDYCAANAFLDAYALYHRAASTSSGKETLAVSINWDAWQEVGMAVEAARKLTSPTQQTVSHSLQISHPLLEKYVVDGPGKERFVTNFSLNKHWQLTDHRVKESGIGLLPGVTYLEMARAAFENHNGPGPAEISDVRFLAPLMVGENDQKETSLILQKQNNSWEFVIKSKVNDQEDKWRKHALGKITTAPPTKPIKHDITEIEARCNENHASIEHKQTSTPDKKESPDGLLYFGPRWRNARWVKYTKDRGLCCLELDEEYAGDLEHYQLHSALLDTSTAFLFGYVHKKSAYIPFGYKRLRMRAPLTRKIFSYSRINKGKQNQQGSLTFDVTIMDENGVELVDIEEFTMLEVSETIKTRIKGKEKGKSEETPLYENKPAADSDNLVKDGISPAEGIEAFDRIVGAGLPRVVVSTPDLIQRIKQTNTIDEERTAGDSLDSDKSAPQHARPEISTRYVAPGTETEKIVAKVWKELLGIKEIGLHDDFFELGGDSLKAVTATGKIHKEIHTEIPLTEFFNRPTVKKLANYIESKTEKIQYHAIEPVEKKEYYGLSSPQRRLFILNYIEKVSTVHNLTVAIKLEGKLDKDRLHDSFQQLIQRHESFRTSFHMIHDQPAQKIHEKVEFDIGYSEIRETQEKLPTVSEFVRPFDLTKAPLMRVTLVKAGPDTHLLVIDMHHIIHDGTSQAIFLNEFLTLYAGKQLPELQVQYKDYAQWQNQQNKSTLIKNQQDYWLKEFQGEIPVLNLPLDYTRPALQSFAGDVVSFELDPKTTSALKALALKEEATLFLVLLSIYNVLLAKLSGQEDIIIGTPVAGRKHPDLLQIIGIFLNTLALRNFPAADKPYEIFLKEIKERTLKSFDNQDFPFEDLVEKLVLKRDLSRNPLFDVMFILHTQFQSSAKTPQVPQVPEITGEKDFPLKAKINDYEKNTSEFDLTLVGFEGDHSLFLNFEYNPKLFEKRTMQRLIDYFKKLVSAVIKNPQQPIANIDIMPKSEKQQLLFNFNDTALDYPTHKTLHELFADQVEKNPNHTALVAQGTGRKAHSPEDRHAPCTMRYALLTYQELNEKSNQLAYLLLEKGVKPDAIVGILVERSCEMIIGLLAILKAGAAYLPLDPEYPPERINYILKNSGTKFLVSKVSKVSMVSRACEVININDIGKGIESSPTHPLNHSPTQLCYIIYTSGSTGNPKGVMIPHKNTVNFIKGMTSIIDFSPGKSILALTTISFDIFFLETLLPLTCGLQVVVASEAQQQDPELLAAAIIGNNINILQATPSRLQLLYNYRDDLQCLQKVETLIVGGEAFPNFLFENIIEEFPGKIYNVYGPTETTIWSTVKDLTMSDPDELTIGTPIANTQIYIVNKDMALQPLGVPGELLIGGDGVASGYLNNIELTAEKFISRKKTQKNTKKCSPQYPITPLPHYPIYMTGDLARWLGNKEIQFLGRIDQQVKIRGFRIELEEIEEQLMKHQNIHEAVVTSKEDQNGNKYLCAYIVSENPKEKTLEIEMFKEHLTAALPDYMIPSYFIPLEKIPLTPNGKIDRRALPDPDSSGSPLKATHVAPETDNEKMIADIWKKLLQIDDVGIYDNFFDLGGNSLNVIQLNRKLREVFNKDIPLALMFRKLTIDFLSQHLGQEEINTTKQVKQQEVLDRARETFKDTISKFTKE